MTPKQERLARTMSLEDKAIVALEAFDIEGFQDLINARIEIETVIHDTRAIDAIVKKYVQRHDTTHVFTCWCGVKHKGGHMHLQGQN